MVLSSLELVLEFAATVSGSELPSSAAPGDNDRLAHQRRFKYNPYQRQKHATDRQDYAVHDHVSLSSLNGGKANLTQKILSQMPNKLCQGRL